jgi:hypothetical protein
MMPKSSIRQFIKDFYYKAKNYYSPLAGNISTSGFCIYPPALESCFFKSSSLLQRSLSSSLRLKQVLQGKPNGFVLNFHDILEHYPHLRFAIDRNILTDIRRYLGPSAKLDAVYLAYYKSVDSSHSYFNASGLYHHDSVGHRLKLFLPLNASGNFHFPTVYLSGSNAIKWSTFLNEKDSAGDRIDPCLAASFREYSISVPFGFRYLFDTNGIHKGMYSPYNENRVILQFEFSTHSFNPFGEIGPQKFFLDVDSYRYFSALGILRRRFVSAVDSSRYIHRSLRHRACNSSFHSISSYLQDL